MSIITHWNKCMYLVLHGIKIKEVRDGLAKKTFVHPMTTQKVSRNPTSDYTVQGLWNIPLSIGLSAGLSRFQLIRHYAVILFCSSPSLSILYSYLASAVLRILPVWSIFTRPPAKSLPTGLVQWGVYALEHSTRDNSRMPWLLMLNPQISAKGNKCAHSKENEIKEK